MNAIPDIFVPKFNTSRISLDFEWKFFNHGLLKRQSPWLIEEIFIPRYSVAFACGLKNFDALIKEKD